MRTLTAVLAVSSLLACTSEPSERGTASDASVSAAADSGERAVTAPWYRRELALDLTGDGQLDSVLLEATGAGTDSLRITLTLIVGGVERHRESWGSSYELALADSSPRNQPQADSLLRARLDSVLSSVVVQRLDDPGVRLMAEDSAILASLEPPPTQRISFSYGYETTVRLVWDAPRQRFVRLWSCC